MQEEVRQLGWRQAGVVQVDQLPACHRPAQTLRWDGAQADGVQTEVSEGAGGGQGVHQTGELLLGQVTVPQHGVSIATQMV